MLRMIDNDFYIEDSEVLLVMSAVSESGKGLLSDAKNVINSGKTKAKRSLIVLKNSPTIIVSTLDPEVIASRLNGEEGDD